MAVKPGLGRRLLQTMGSLRTGIVLLIIVGIASAAGTVILQRPITDPEQMQETYSAQTLRVLDAIGLTDLYHSWWYLTLLGLLALSIILVSVDRWPNAWRFYSRPYRRTDSSFRAVLPLQKSLPVRDAAQALDATERVLRKHGLRPERIVENDEISLYAEKSRFAVMAVYVVHASLLLIMAGGIVDGIWGYKGYVNLVAGQPAISQVELRDGSIHKLPFELRCDEAGQENYTGEYKMMPKRWWSKLVVLQNGQEKERKEIAVNDPLVHSGIRFYQSSYGLSGEMKSARLAMIIGNDMTPRNVVQVEPNATATFEDGTSLKLTRFLPDAYVMDAGGGVYQRSKDLGNAAAQVDLTDKSGKTQTVWMFRSDRSGPNDVVLIGPYDEKGNAVSLPFQLVARLDMLPYTGLQVSHEPGQWAVWSGCLLMGVGLFMAFWVLHQRFWVVPITNKEGHLALWIGAAANKNREGFTVRFNEVTADLENELKAVPQVAGALQASAASS